MNRSLREIRMFILLALPLLCALRIGERCWILFQQPMRVQHQIFGHVVVPPWRLRQLKFFMSPESHMSWTYDATAVPSPLRRCIPDEGHSFRDGAPFDCGFVGDGDAHFSAQWDGRQLKIGEDHGEPAQ